jgi:hypothetical protein
MNKFLQNLNQRGGSPAPAPITPTPVRSSTSSASAGSSSAEYDPIRRLAEELSRHSGAIEGLTALIMGMNERPQAATQAEMKTLLETARAGVTYKPDADTIATLLLPKLTAGMPNMENIKAAANTAVSAIQESGNQTAGQINGAGVIAAQRIEKAARQQADVLASRIGFTSWQSALFIFSMFLLLVIGTILSNQNRESELAKTRAQLQGVREFTDWVKEQPVGRQLYDRYYHQ